MSGLPRREILKFIPGALAASAAAFYARTSNRIAEIGNRISQQPTPEQWLKQITTEIPGAESIVFVPGGHLVDNSVIARLHDQFSQGKLYNFFQSDQPGKLGVSAYADVVADLTRQSKKIGATANDSVNRNIFPEGQLTDARARENILVIGIGTEEVFQGNSQEKPHGVKVLATDQAFFSIGRGVINNADFTTRLAELEQQLIDLTVNEITDANTNLQNQFGIDQLFGEVFALAAYVSSLNTETSIIAEMRQTRRQILPLLGTVLAFAGAPILAQFIAGTTINADQAATETAATLEANQSAAKLAEVDSPKGEGVNWANARVYKSIIATAYVQKELKNQGKMDKDAVVISAWGSEHAESVGASWKDMQEAIQT